MPASPPPSPAYVATVTPFDLHSEPMRQVRLSARQVDALDGLAVPIHLASPSRWTVKQQAELAIQGAVAAILTGRHVSADLWRDEDAGDVSVWHEETFISVADVVVTPARVAERAVA